MSGDSIIIRHTSTTTPHPSKDDLALETFRLWWFFFVLHFIKPENYIFCLPMCWKRRRVWKSHCYCLTEVQPYETWEGERKQRGKAMEEEEKRGTKFWVIHAGRVSCWTLLTDGFLPGPSPRRVRGKELTEAMQRGQPKWPTATMYPPAPPPPPPLQLPFEL